MSGNGRAAGYSAPVVLVVAYQADDDLQRCLAALGRPEAVTVVDNAVSAVTRGLVDAAGAAYLPSPGNPGFAAGVNLGLAHVGGNRDVLLLNPDAQLGWSDVLAMQDGLRGAGRRHAAVGPRLVGASGEPQPADWPLPCPGQVWFDALGMNRLWRGRRFVTGAVLLLRAESLAELGGFDERFFLYAEEADWQRRALDAGWTVAVIDEVTAVHTGATSSTDPAVRDAHARHSGSLYASKWFGPRRVQVMHLGSSLAAQRRRLISSTPARAARPAGTSTRCQVVHVVRSDGFAGVERYIADTAAETVQRGWDVVVIGGDPQRMRAALPDTVIHEPAATVGQVARALRRHRRADVVHAHMTAAEFPAAVLKTRGGRLIVTRHFAARRGRSLPTRLVAGAVRRRIDVQISVSAFVAGAIGEPSVVLHSGVTASTRPRGARDRVVVVLQRLEPEKDTITALRAWKASGLAADGWRMVVHGSGSQESALRRAAGPGVEFAGVTDDPRAVLGRAALLLAPTPTEGLGLGVVEAMAEAVPVLAADGGAHRETLGPDGTYFPPGDAQYCGAILRDYATDDARRARAGDAGRDRHAALFTIGAHVDRLLGLYASHRRPRVALLSLEPWDEVWRRNQHLASRLAESGAVGSLVFVEPPRGGLAPRATRSCPLPGIEVVTPPLLVPRRAGGHQLLGGWLRRELADVDVVWANDPVAGAALLPLARPTVYDVTDDWRALHQPAADRARIVAAEDLLARHARTVVCSQVLADRWRERYGIHAALVPNGVDVDALRAAEPIVLDGSAPHAVYVGTVHDNRVDVALVADLAASMSVHLVGPDGLTAAQRAPLQRAGVRLHGAVPSNAVGSWLAAADVLICPHVVDEFTLSLDAIKAHEYLATDRPVVATPSSGFQDLTAIGLTVCDRTRFVETVQIAVGTAFRDRGRPADWVQRADEFASVLRSATR